MSLTFRPSASAIRWRFSAGGGDVDVTGRDRADAQLLEVGVRGVEEAAALGRGEDGDRAALAGGDEVRALERVDRDVDRGDRPVVVVAADLLADVEHRRLVALALADDDRARRCPISSIVRRIASVAARSASSRSPRPMNRAEAIAAASVTRTISSASSCSIGPPPGSEPASPRLSGGSGAGR